MRNWLKLDTNMFYLRLGAGWVHGHGKGRYCLRSCIGSISMAEIFLGVFTWIGNGGYGEFRLARCLRVWNESMDLLQVAQPFHLIEV